MRWTGAELFPSETITVFLWRVAFHATLFLHLIETPSKNCQPLSKRYYHATSHVVFSWVHHQLLRRNSSSHIYTYNAHIICLLTHNLFTIYWMRATVKNWKKCIRNDWNMLICFHFIITLYRLAAVVRQSVWGGGGWKNWGCSSWGLPHHQHHRRHGMMAVFDSLVLWHSIRSNQARYYQHDTFLIYYGQF